MNRLVLTLLAGLFLLTSCNQQYKAPEEESEYKKENDAYFEKISKDPNYKELKFHNHPNVVYYKVLKQSDQPNGPRPFQNSTIRIVVKGKFITEEVFQPEQEMVTPLFDITENGQTQAIIQGLRYALQRMTEGDIWEIVVPYTLGYGEYQNPRQRIPAYSTLIFTVELKKIIKQ